jgi:hypothetical protein
VRKKQEARLLSKKEILIIAGLSNLTVGVAVALSIVVVFFIPALYYVPPGSMSPYLTYGPAYIMLLLWVLTMLFCIYEIVRPITCLIFYTVLTSVLASFWMIILPFGDIVGEGVAGGVVTILLMWGQVYKAVAHRSFIESLVGKEAKQKGTRSKKEEVFNVVIWLFFFGLPLFLIMI